MQTPWYEKDALAQANLMARGYRHWFGEDLVTPKEGQSLAESFFEAPRVIVSHGTEPDPILNYGNRTALDLWETDWATLRATASRFTAEAPNREERARLLAAVTRDGFIKNYAGVRVSSTGRRFRIAQATVWNLIDEHGTYCGQAATFDRWEYL